jgi:acyl-CoA synthetase (AMP-forming)/AMP-acid ligase II
VPDQPAQRGGENRELLDLFDCTCLIFQSSFAPLVEQIAGRLPKLRVLVCLDEDTPEVPSFARWLDGAVDEGPAFVPPPDDVAMIVGTGGTTGRPKGVVLTGRPSGVSGAGAADPRRRGAVLPRHGARG